MQTAFTIDEKSNYSLMITSIHLITRKISRMAKNQKKNKILLLILSSVVAVLAIFLTVEALTDDKRLKYNPELKFVKENWHGNPLDKDGLYVNHECPMTNDITRVIKWQLSKNPQKEEKMNDTFRLKTINADEFLKSDKDGMIWIGHASFLFRIKGKLLITDPVFTTPSPLMKRYSSLPFDPYMLTGVDYILITHDHYDHLNKESIKLLVKNNPKVVVLTGLELGQYINDWLNGNDYIESGWYQQYNLENEEIRITYLPSRHWSSRGLGANNKRLWGAFMIQTDTLSIYFGGDSGYGSHFAEVKELFGNVDYAIIGIGAYKPEWFMSPAHLGPADGLKAANDMSATNLIPMHFGTFDLSDEPIGDPYREVHKFYNSDYKDKLKLITPDIGQIINF